MEKNQGITVYNVGKARDFVTMMAMFKKKVVRSGILQEYRASLRYMKPSERKRLKQRRAVKRARKIALEV